MPSTRTRPRQASASRYIRMHFLPARHAERPGRGYFFHLASRCSAFAALPRLAERGLRAQPAKGVGRRPPRLAELAVADHGFLPASQGIGRGRGARPGALVGEEPRHVTIDPQRRTQALARGVAVALTPEDG